MNPRKFSISQDGLRRISYWNVNLVLEQEQKWLLCQHSWNICLWLAQHSVRPERDCTRCGWTIQSCSLHYMPTLENFWSLLWISLSSLYFVLTITYTWQELSHLTCTENTTDLLRHSMTPPCTRYWVNFVLIYSIFQLWDVTASAWKYWHHPYLKL